MAEFSIVEARPESPWAVEAYHRLDVEYSIEAFGEDLTTSAERTRHYLAYERTAIRGLLLALPGEAGPGRVGRFGVPAAPDAAAQPLGAAIFSLPTSDNQHLVDDLFILVPAGQRRQGIGRALFHQVRGLAPRHGRDTVLCWTEHLLTPASAALAQLSAPTGSGSIAADGNAHFAQAMGCELAQVERQSRLTLPVEAALLGGLAARAASLAGDRYHLVSWLGATPDDQLARVAQLNRAMSIDAPVGDVDFQAESWDAERVRGRDEQLLRSGQLVTTLALTNAGDEAAGITVLFVPDDSPERPEQHTTVVLAEHRGHRLGLWLKSVNLALLAAEFPQARHIDTWNADENSHMLAINTALGYRPHGVTGAWQLRLRPA